MIKILVFPIFILLIPFLSSANNSKIRKHYELINSAEMQIVDSNYQIALNYYLEAFKYKNPNGEDLANAFQAAFIIRDTTNAKNLLNQLAAKGLHPTYYKNCPQFSAYNIDSVYFKYLRSEYDSLYEISQKKYKPFGDSFAIFVKEDQRFRKERELNPDLNVDSLDRINERNLYNHIKATAFPTFENVGFWGALGRSHYMDGVCWLIAWHRRPEKSIIEDLILEQVLLGNYIPELYAGILDGRNDGKYGIQLVHIGLDRLSKKQISKINKDRKKIYLESIEDFIKKNKFQNNDDRFLLVSPFYNGFNKAVEKAKKDGKL
ncbi:hypothetical protein D3C87_129970 [compost metagenome]